MEEQLCEVCGKNRADLECDGCGKSLCRECEHFEIWGTEPGEFAEKHFCADCFCSPEKNPWHSQDVRNGLHELSQAVRELQQKTGGRSRLFRGGRPDAKIA